MIEATVCDPFYYPVGERFVAFVGSAEMVVEVVEILPRVGILRQYRVVIVDKEYQDLF